MKWNREQNSKFWSLSWWRLADRRAGATGHNVAELPLRGELFSAQQMELHGKALASAHRLSVRREPDQLLARLADNEAVLVEASNLLVAAVKANRRISPAGEWLLDNLYLIEEQVRTARLHLPRGYSRELPRLAHGPSAGLPRVYDIALETISHGDGRLDPESLSGFITAYQKVSALKLGELWAVPIMLRLALIENLRRVGSLVASSTLDRERAEVWADQMMAVAEQDPKSLIVVVADMARSNPPMKSAFVAELARRLQGQSAALALPLTWIEQHLAESGLTIEQLVQAETQKQASAQVSIANSIGSLRFLGAMDWRDFVESMSGVEKKLREDPAGVYAKMDFATRDRYRHAVEEIAKASKLSEGDVARKAIQLAHDNAAEWLACGGSGIKVGESRNSHVGYHLIDEGLPKLEQAAEVRFSLAAAVCRTGHRFPLFFYLGTAVLLTLAFSRSLMAILVHTDTSSVAVAMVALLVAMCMGQLAFALTQLAATMLVKPKLLPRMDFSKGIPADCRTLVVIPSLLTNLADIEALAEALEVRFLANRDKHLYFGLLTDFSDAKEQTQIEDEPLLALAKERIEALNQKYAPTDGPAFFLFHRARQWNAHEQRWMGYERKRGKLADLNALLRGGNGECFSLIIGVTEVLGRITYVITLDTDTKLPRDAARQFVATMAHPLNRAQFDEGHQCVRRGHGILQPRVAMSLAGSNQSRYARLFGSEFGIDPYTRAVSDVYQDVFGEGSFIGKGIYEVDAFERALKGRFPENRILSHDLLEGCYARAALLSDVQLFEEYPGSYHQDVSRRHRWIRGDWQIASWVLSSVPNNRPARPESPTSGAERNPLSLLSQWKILDNLRRSLLPLAATLLLLTSWTLLPQPWLWTLAVIGMMIVPHLLASIHGLFSKPEDVLPKQHLVVALRSVGRQIAQAAFTLSCLPYEAYFSLDAILRTNWRIFVTKTRLLEWVASGVADRSAGNSLPACIRSMWIGPVCAGVLAAYLVMYRPMVLLVAGPILLLWLASPAIAWWMSRPRARPVARLTVEQTGFLQKNARLTWGFFETFVGPEDHWLPPDNFQEQPVEVIAHRTSPTNMGLALLANLAASDFGYIATGPMLDRIASALKTMAGLARHQGHFYNWYDTRTLQPLTPMYISSVDSGNLAAHLLTLRPGLLERRDQKIIEIRFFEGLMDTMKVLIEAAPQAPSAVLVLFDRLQQELESAYDSRPVTFVAAQIWLARLENSAAEVVAALEAVGAQSARDDAAKWARALKQQCSDGLHELALFAPWLSLPEAPEKVRKVLDAVGVSNLHELAARRMPWMTAIEQLVLIAEPEERMWLALLQQRIVKSSENALERIETIEQLARQAGDMANMKYDFLYDEGRHLLAIGYDVGERRLDGSFYDLLASEARLASFVAIAQGQIPQEGWFALGRLLTNVNGQPILMSWSGSMFEYLMPLLVMRTYENTLLDQTCLAAVEEQIAYGKQRGVAWGISESGYNAVDSALNYQYRAFGVPGLGLKRGLAEDLVIAPYASALALMVAPEESCLNLQRLAREGVTGKYGFYEAVDYTPSRLPHGKSRVIVQSFMAHHQGMIFLSLACLLLGRQMQRRFESEPMFQATNPLLQERVPRAGDYRLHHCDVSAVRKIGEDDGARVRIIASPDTSIPEVQLLSNGRYHVMVTNAGGGYSRWKDLAVSRWHEDATRDNWGTFCYIRDLSSEVFWSNTHQPTLKPAESYQAIFSEGRAEFRRRDLDYDTHTEIVVSPEDDIELRRIHIRNRASHRRTIEVTSYAEVVLAPPIADALHPAFGNLFVQTEIIRERQAILCTRRPRSVAEQVPWMFHLMTVRGVAPGTVSYETDRMRFIGRTRTVASPQALRDRGELSGSEGSVLDPIVAIRHRITLEADQVATIDIVTGVAASREGALNLAGKYQDRHLADRVFELAWTHSQVVLGQINASEADAQLYGRLARSVIYANASLRADPAVIVRNRRGQSGLWGYAISGDLPIVLLQIGDIANIELVKQMVRAHAYWRLKGLAVDLVIWNEDRAGYRQVLHDLIVGLIAGGVEAPVVDKPGGIFVRPAEQISDEDRLLVQAVARIIVTDRRGALGDQINRRRSVEMQAKPISVPRFKAVQAFPAENRISPPRQASELQFANGLGGFSADGREYVINTAHGRVTPAPWVNVLANPTFGSVVSDSGMGYTWNENAHEFRLSPWGNDPVSDPCGEAFYLRDEETGSFWSPTPLPSRGAEPYTTRHGFGYSRFEHTENGIRSELTVYVALDSAVKFSVWKLHNESGRSRRLSATGYVEWVLGDLRHKSAMHVVTEIDPQSGALYARNSYSADFADQIVFFDVDEGPRTYSGDRAEFVGRNGTLGNPAAMSRTQLSNKVGAALDPCGAIQIALELGDGESREIIFRLGAGRHLDETRKLLQRHRGPFAALNEMERVQQYWRRTLGTIRVETPNQALNVLTNGWLVYQTLACRLWARSGYYQSSGAFGFRDQLQDVMALVHTEPALARKHLLLCAAHQFREGDVQHWWQPTSNRGIRSHCSDDYLWLPLALCRYVLTTGDNGILDESIPFLEGRHVKSDEESYYDLPERSREAASLYEHAVRSVSKSLNFGERGLPRMGSGDWNDGMNLVGEGGKGQSVWLGFFVYDVLTKFAKIARSHGDPTFADRCQKEAAQLQLNLEHNGWDGEWYLRAFFDDGEPLGSAGNAECQIDSISQSWAVLSGAGNPERSRTAMAAVDKRLVRREHGLIQLLDPPFDKSPVNPGYIKGYVPGVRENGGQYTHAAVWTAMAFATLGNWHRAWELFDMINPINHANSATAIAIYKVEPYVVAADVYAVAPHTGRGGWTWYTGSAGWMYRLIVESLLGLTLESDKLRIKPCLPEDWKTFTIDYRYRETMYHITVRQTLATGESYAHSQILLDGITLKEEFISLVNDQLAHKVEISIRRSNA